MDYRYIVRFVFQRKLLDVSLGFAAGVMIAASYWSLLAPAIEMATVSKTYGDDGEFAFIPVAVGFLVGAAFVYGTDVLISSLGIQSPNVLLAMQSVGTKQRRRIHEKLKSDEDLDDNDALISGVQISGGKMYTHVESTTIDGIGNYFNFFFFTATHNWRTIESMSRITSLENRISWHCKFRRFGVNSPLFASIDCRIS